MNVVDLASQGELTSILGRYREGLERLYAERLRGLYLFGSCARGDAEEGSDVDVLVILDEVESTWSEIQRTSELTLIAPAGWGSNRFVGLPEKPPQTAFALPTTRPPRRPPARPTR